MTDNRHEKSGEVWTGEGTTWRTRSWRLFSLLNFSLRRVMRSETRSWSSVRLALNANMPWSASITLQGRLMDSWRVNITLSSSALSLNLSHFSFVTAALISSLSIHTHRFGNELLWISKSTSRSIFLPYTFFFWFNRYVKNKIYNIKFIQCVSRLLNNMYNNNFSKMIWWRGTAQKKHILAQWHWHHLSPYMRPLQMHNPQPGWVTYINVMLYNVSIFITTLYNDILYSRLLVLVHIQH